MKNCTSYNKQVDLSPYPNLSLVCYGFMNGCDNFTSLNIGDVKEKEFDQDGAENDKYTLSTTNSSAIMYTTGVTVTGTEAEEFQIRFGDLTTGPEYRTIIV